MDLDRNTHCMATHKSKTPMFSRILRSKYGMLGEYSDWTT